MKKTIVALCVVLVASATVGCKTTIREAHANYGVAGQMDSFKTDGPLVSYEDTEINSPNAGMYGLGVGLPGNGFAVACGVPGGACNTGYDEFIADRKRALGTLAMPSPSATGRTAHTAEPVDEDLVGCMKDVVIREKDSPMCRAVFAEALEHTSSMKRSECYKLAAHGNSKKSCADLFTEIIAKHDGR